MQAFSAAKILDFYKIPYTRAGAKLRINCPFHAEENASCYISSDFRWYCFGCARHGDLIDFLAEIDAEAKQRFLQLNDLQKLLECGIILRKAKAGQIGDYVRRAASAGHGGPSETEAEESRLKAWQYFAGLPRVDWEDIACHSAGEFDEAKNYIFERGFEPWLLKKCNCKFDYRRDYPLIFPICENRIFRGWVARTTAAGHEPKYLYNAGFVKRDCLAGLYGSSDSVVVTEGLLDRLKLNQTGFVKNAVALLGWHLSEQQAEKLKNAGIKFVVCALDNDDAGSRGFARLEEVFQTFRFRYPPGVKDLGELSGRELKNVCSTNLSLFARWKNGNFG